MVRDRRILFDKDNQNKIPVSCNSFMTILYSLLRWSGFKTAQLVQFRIVNQDYLIVQSDKQKHFLISHDRLTVCSKRSIYPQGKINKVFGAEWFIDFKNNYAEASPLLIQEYNHIAETTFLPICHLKGNENGLLLTDKQFTCCNFREYLFRLDDSICSSIFLWTKYANQSLLVSQPETYIYWSVQSNWGSVSFKNEQEVYQYIEHFKKKSIFPEDDRIMTADQCIRYQTGSNKDIAVFLFSALKKFFNVEGYVVFTQRSEYCVYRRHINDELIVYDIGDLAEKKLIEGEIVLVFNDTNSSFPLREKNNIRRAWYNEITEIKKEGDAYGQ